MNRLKLTARDLLGSSSLSLQFRAEIIRTEIIIPSDHLRLCGLWSHNIFSCQPWSACV